MNPNPNPPENPRKKRYDEAFKHSAVRHWYVGPASTPCMGGGGGSAQTFPDVLFSDPSQWDWQASQPQPVDGSGNFIRGLDIGTSHVLYNAQYPDWLAVSDSRRVASLTFRAPAQYPTGKPVILTLEGVDCGHTGEETNLGQIKLKWQGNLVEPVAWSNEIGTVSYRVLIDGDVTSLFQAR